MGNRIKTLKALFTAKAATGVIDTPLNIAQQPYVTVCVATTGSASLTMKFQASISAAAPNFANASTPSNSWDYVGVYDYQSGAFIAGDTGVVFTGTDDVRYFRINADLFEWLSAVVTAYAAGSLTVTAVRGTEA